MRRLCALSRRGVRLSLYDRESRAGERLRLAGFSSGRGDCARGGCSAGGCGSCAGLRSFYAGRAFLLGCLVLVRAHHTFLPKCFMLDHACCLPHERQTGRLAICSVPVPPWVVIAIRAFSGCRAVIGLGWFTSGLCVSLWRSRQGTKRRGNAENGVGGAAECAFA